MKKNSTEKIIVNYHALLYNMPPVNRFAFEGHIFNTQKLTGDEVNIVIPKNNILYTNGSFAQCCISTEKGKVLYVVATPEKPLELPFDGQSDSELENRALSIVSRTLEELEKKLLTITNLHIFVSSVEISIWNQSTNKTYIVGTFFNRPMGTWAEWSKCKQIICNRLAQNINWRQFEQFMCRKECIRYEKAYNFYIKSFFESCTESAFCMLVTSLDALFGNGKNIKERLAKYTSVMLCEPANMNSNGKMLKNYYKKRSDYVHGKKNRITEEDEWKLREFVRKVIIMTFLIWEEAGIKNDSQFFKLLDKIHERPSLYLEKALAAYTFAGLVREQETNGVNVIKMDIIGKVKTIYKIFEEANIDNE